MYGDFALLQNQKLLGPSLRDMSLLEQRANMHVADNLF